VIIQKDGNTYGLAGGFHLRKRGDTELRVSSVMGGYTIASADADADYDRIQAALAKGEAYIDLDAKPTKARTKKAPAKEAETEATPADAPSE
jgi:hypothetical protein